MTRRVPLDDERESKATMGNCRIMIGHRDEAIGATLALLLAVKHYQILYATNLATLSRQMACWRPQALLFDTRLHVDSRYAFVRSLREDDRTARLLIAYWTRSRLSSRPASTGTCEDIARYGV
ncbi:hypothetical protein [Caballeronia sp. GAFFF1]|uniref:hypothetical protein n=1 Tax=Caballeronia sp. GAFFF1 TaxID=2921779 RepID=UPI002027EB1F|nr:hypothetical protein [Caballeronia sp. GAFFF1]